MAKKAKIKGFQKVSANLNKEILAIEGYSMQGLILSVIEIHRSMQTVSPTIPVDLGNLEASFFYTPHRTLQGPSVLYGFTANYAAYVHEMVGANFKKPGSGAKFLEYSIKRNRKVILEIIRRTAKIKP